MEREAVYMELGGPPRQNGWRVVWDGRYVYSPVGFQILYDHKTDPFERYNLFGLLEHAQVEARLKKLLVSLAEPPLLQIEGAEG